MVLVRVGEEHAAHLLLVLDEVGEVGDDDVDARHLLVGEAQAAVDHDDVVLLPDDGTVLADLAHATERDDLYQCHWGKGTFTGDLYPIKAVQSPRTW